MIGQQKGGSDDRILQVKGKMNRGPKRASGLAWACINAKHVVRMSSYQLFFLGPTTDRRDVTP